MSLRQLSFSALVLIPLTLAGAGCGRTKCDVGCVEGVVGSGGSGNDAGHGGAGGTTGIGGGRAIGGAAGSAAGGATGGGGGTVPATGSDAGGAVSANGGAGGTAAGSGGAGGTAAVGGGAAACLPPSSTKCVQPAPSFATDISPLLDRSCNTCHADDNPDGVWPLHAYADVSAWSQLIIGDLVNCTMPPADSDTPFPESDRQRLFAWLACGSPDN